MIGLIIAIHVLVCLFLIFVILIQPGKGYGLSETFGGQAQTLFGTRTATFMTRATTYSAAIFLITCLSLAVMHGKRTRSIMERIKAGESKKESAPKAKGSVMPTTTQPTALPVNPASPAESTPQPH